MLLGRVRDPLWDPEWILEIKWDIRLPTSKMASAFGFLRKLMSRSLPPHSDEKPVYSPVKTFSDE
jgi:hypothetical protein